jgi:Phosphotransferase enzyme family
VTAPSPSAHTRYATRLAALQADEAFLPPVMQAAEWLGLPAGDGPLQRDYARFHPHREPFATLTLWAPGEPEPLLRVEAHDGRPAARGGREAVVASAAGWLRVTPFASDPALGSLPALLARPGRHTVVRYRPYRRCTVRFDDANGTLYAKVFAERRGRCMRDDGARLWAAAERGQIRFAVPRPQRYDPAGRTLWQSCVPGQPVGEELKRGDGPALALRMGRALASLAKADLAPHRLMTATAFLSRSARVGRSLIRSVPDVEREVDELLTSLRDAHAAAGAGRLPLAPVHGNPHAGQWVEDEGSLGLVDFDGLATGHAELDAAALLADLEFEDPARVPVERLRAAVLAGYREGGVTLDAGLIAVHRAHRRLAKALRVAGSLRPDGDARARRHLDRALRELSEEVA